MSNPFASLIPRRRQGDTTATAPPQRRAGEDPFASLIPKAETPDGGKLRLDNLIRAGTTGATLGINDEIAGGVAGLMAMWPGGKSPKEAYNEEAERVRKLKGEFRDAHPVFAGVTEAAGSFLTGGGAIRTAAKLIPKAVGATKAASALTRSGIAPGALFGGVAGAAEAEGGLPDRLTGGVAGMLLGSTVAGGLTGAVKLGSKVVGGAARAVTPYLRKQTPDRKAVALLGEALGASGKSHDEILAAAAELTAQGKPATLLDVGGTNVQRLARGAQAVPGSRASEVVRETLEQRNLSEPSRVLKDVEGAFGRTKENFVAAVSNLKDRMKAAAAPLYEEAYAHGVVRDPRVAEVLRIPQFARAFKEAQQLAQVEGVTLPNPFMVGGANTASGILVVHPPTVQTLDYMKRAIDGIARSAGAPQKGSFSRTVARALQKRLRGVLDIVDNEVPAYAKARAQWAGDAAMLDAAEEGAKVLRLSPDAIAAKMASMGPGEAEMFQRAALDNIVAKLSATRATTGNTAGVFPSQLRVDQVRAVLQDETAFQEFATRLMSERRMRSASNFVLGGSNTAEKLGDVAKVSGVGPMMQLLAGSGVPGLATLAAGAAAKKAGSQRALQVADALSRRVMAGEGGLADVLREITEAAQRQATSQARRLAAQRAVGAVSGLRLPN